MRRGFPKDGTALVRFALTDCFPAFDRLRLWKLDRVNGYEHSPYRSRIQAVGLVELTVIPGWLFVARASAALIHLLAGFSDSTRDPIADCATQGVPDLSRLILIGRNRVLGAPASPFISETTPSTVTRRDKIRHADQPA